MVPSVPPHSRCFEHPPRAGREWPPAAERLENGAHCAVEAGDDRLAELTLEPLCGRVRKPGAATNEQRVSCRGALERLAAEPIGQLGTLAQIGALEMCGLLRLGRAANKLDVPAAKKSRELPIDGVVPFVGDDQLADAKRLRGVDRIKRGREHRHAALVTQPREQALKSFGPETEREWRSRLQDEVSAAGDKMPSLRLDGRNRALEILRPE